MSTIAIYFFPYFWNSRQPSVPWQYLHALYVSRYTICLKSFRIFAGCRSWFPPQFWRTLGFRKHWLFCPFPLFQPHNVISLLLLCHWYCSQSQSWVCSAGVGNPITMFVVFDLKHVNVKSLIAEVFQMNILSSSWDSIKKALNRRWKFDQNILQ